MVGIPTLAGNHGSGSYNNYTDNNKSVRKLFWYWLRAFWPQWLLLELQDTIHSFIHSYNRGAAAVAIVGWRQHSHHVWVWWLRAGAQARR